MTEELFFFLVSALFIGAGVIVVLGSFRHRARLMEMVHKERLAMIERGVVPSPEQDPERFEAYMHGSRPRGASRSQSVGVVFIGFGLALATLISFTAGDPQIGIGIGGAIAILGAAFVVNARLSGGPGASRGAAPEPPPLPDRRDPTGPTS